MTPFRLYIFLLCGMVLLSCASDDVNPIDPSVGSFEDIPDKIDIITSDIDLFWQLFDDAAGTYTDENFLTNYFRGGSNELSLFFDAKIQNTQRLTSKLSDSDYHQYYTSVRTNTESAALNVQVLQNALNDFEQSYPAAVYTDLALVIGALGTGGTVVSNGSMVIGVEFFTRSPETPISGLDPWVQEVTRESSYLPAIVIHELVHVQQRYFALNENLSASGTLLEVALAEGIADFVTDIIININFNDHLPPLADPIEETLWLEFQAEMNGNDLSRWLFNASNSGDRPADLGYYMGYKIAEHFYNKQSDKTVALKELMEIRSAADFLVRSDYANKFN